MDWWCNVTEDEQKRLAQILHYEFRNSALLEEAFTHLSYSHDQGGGFGNERLEFLGDAVLGLVIAQKLFVVHPDWREGELSRARASLVNTHALAHRSRQLGLGAFLKLGKTELRTGGHEKVSILGNLFEAVLGALYLDGGFAAAERFVARVFAQDFEAGALVAVRDPKTRFQEWAHADRRMTPHYRMLADSGIDGDETRFEAEVLLDDEAWGRGSGRTKRDAEYAAAHAALRKVENDDEETTTHRS